jgi:hypothetical protein
MERIGVELELHPLIWFDLIHYNNTLKIILVVLCISLDSSVGLLVGGN